MSSSPHPPDSSSAPDVREDGVQGSALLDVLQGIDDHVAAYDAHWCFTFVNDSAARMLGRPADQLVGRCLWELFPEAVGNQYHRELHEARATQRVIRSEHYYAPFGRWYEHHIYPTRDGVTVFATDVTWRKRAEAEVDFSTRRFVDTVEHLSDSFTAVDAEWRISYMNHAAKQWTGVDATVIGGDFWALFPQAVGTPFGEAMRRVMRTRQAESMETTSARSGRWFESSIFPSADGIGMLSRDIHARKQAEAALVAADRRKDEFLATLGHELRNPLAPIRTAAEVLRLVDGHAPQAARAREIIERQVEQLTRLVDDLLDVSRITRGQVELRRRTADLADIVDQAIEAAAPIIEARGHTLVRTLASQRLLVDGDPARLAQVVSNLLHNAAKYTPEGGRIEVGVAHDGDCVRLAVRDNGLGLAPDHRDRIFELFAQVARDKAHGGLGIGLTIARELVERHGGTLAVHSEGLGQGSEFTVTLPALPGGADLPVPAAPPRPQEAAAAGPCVRRVLVVDDNRDAADALAASLTLAGHVLRVAYSGGSALDAARDFRPEIVLLDIGLPGMSGYDVARAMRRDPMLSQARLVAVTGWSQPDDRRKAREAGFDVHLVKPVDLHVLTQLLA